MNQIQNKVAHSEYFCDRCGIPMERKDFIRTSVFYCPKCGENKITTIKCEHDYVWILFELENGNRQLRKYCKKCKLRDPKIYSQKDVDLSKIPLKLEEEYKMYYNDMCINEAIPLEKFRDELFKKKNGIFYKTYVDYIDSPEWKEKRHSILIRDSYTCQICGNAGNNVHHLSYAHFGNEYDFELVTLCENCHIKEYHTKEVENKIEKLMIPPKDLQLC